MLICHMKKNKTVIIAGVQQCRMLYCECLKIKHHTSAYIVFHVFIIIIWNLPTACCTDAKIYCVWKSDSLKKCYVEYLKSKTIPWESQIVQNLGVAWTPTRLEVDIICIIYSLETKYCYFNELKTKSAFPNLPQNNTHTTDFSFFLLKFINTIICNLFWVLFTGKYRINK